MILKKFIRVGQTEVGVKFVGVGVESESEIDSIPEMSRLCFSRLRIRPNKLTSKSNLIRIQQNWVN